MLPLSFGADVSCEITRYEHQRRGGFEGEKIVDVSHYCRLAKNGSITTPDTVLSNPRNDDVDHFEFGDNRKVEYLPINIHDTFPNLAIFNAYACSLKSVSYQHFRGLNKLRQLSLSRNELTSLDEHTFDDLGRVLHLHLTENKISSLHPKIFSNMVELEMLHLNENKLTQLDVELFKNTGDLGILIMNNNEIQSLPAGIFDSSVKLRQIWLHHNQISELPANLFDHCASLSDINLSNNKITKIPTSLIANSPRMSNFEINDNPLSEVDFAMFDNNPRIVQVRFNGKGDIKIKNVERVDKMNQLDLVLLFNYSCINGSYAKEDWEKLKSDVNANCL